MKVAASHVVKAPKEAVWAALRDPAVLARTLPGCLALEVVGPDRYALTVHAGVASVKGTYQGTVELCDLVEPDALRLTASGAGAPGTITADTRVRLDAVDGGTRIGYDADAVVGGMIGGVGQRMLVGVTKKTAAEFFTALEDELLHGPRPAAAAAPAETAAAPAGAPSGAPAVGQVFAGGRAEPARAADPWALLAAALLGAAVALVGDRKSVV